MKLNVKKVNCRSCRRLVVAREEKVANGNVRLLCMKCGNLVYEWNGAMWRPA